MSKGGGGSAKSEQQIAIDSGGRTLIFAPLTRILKESGFREFCVCNSATNVWKETGVKNITHTQHAKHIHTQHAKH